MRRIMIAVLCLLSTACEYGLVKSQQNPDVVAVVDACWAHGGKTVTSFFPFNRITTVSCQWVEEKR